MYWKTSQLVKGNLLNMVELENSLRARTSKAAQYSYLNNFCMYRIFLCDNSFLLILMTYIFVLYKKETILMKTSF